MKSHKQLILVSSRPGGVVRSAGARSHLRLVHSASAPTDVLAPPPAVLLAPTRVLRQGLLLPPRSLTRPFWQRMLQLAGDVVVVFVALVVGLRPNA